MHPGWCALLSTEQFLLLSPAICMIHTHVLSPVPYAPLKTFKYVLLSTLCDMHFWNLHTPVHTPEPCTLHKMHSWVLYSMYYTFTVQYVVLSPNHIHHFTSLPWGEKSEEDSCEYLHLLSKKKRNQKSSFINPPPTHTLTRTHNPKWKLTIFVVLLPLGLSSAHKRMFGHCSGQVLWAQAEWSHPHSRRDHDNLGSQKVG